MSIHVGSSLGCPPGWASPVLRAWSLPRALGGMLATLSSFLHLAFLTRKVRLLNCLTVRVSGTQGISRRGTRRARPGVGQGPRARGPPHRVCCNWERRGSRPGHSWSSSLSLPVRLPRQAASLGNTDLLGPSPASAAEAGLVGDPPGMRVISSCSAFCKFSPGSW